VNAQMRNERLPASRVEIDSMTSVSLQVGSCASVKHREQEFGALTKATRVLSAVSNSSFSTYSSS
jgi:hypothetical protein